MIKEVARIHESNLQTPIVTYRNETTASRIDVVGTMHMAKQAYYDTISTFTDSREEAGAIVHFERVSWSSRQAIREAGFETWRAFRRINQTSSVASKLMIDAFGLVSQREALPIKETWENHDISPDLLVAHLGKKAIAMMTLSGKLASFYSKLPIPLDITRELIANRWREGLEDNFALGDKDLENGIEIQRNIEALSAVQSAITKQPDQDIVMLWGAAHLTGFDPGLQELGYSQSATTWLTAFSLNQE